MLLLFLLLFLLSPGETNEMYLCDGEGRILISECKTEEFTQCLPPKLNSYGYLNGKTRASGGNRWKHLQSSLPSLLMFSSHHTTNHTPLFSPTTAYS